MEKLVIEGIKEGDPPITIAIIDSGIDCGHLDLVDSIIWMESFVLELPFQDQLGHGTHVAGILVGKETGVARHARIVVLKIFDQHGRSNDKALLSALERARELKVDIITMSLGMKGIDIAVERELNRSISEGIIVLAAPGNDGAQGPQDIAFPATMQNLITVGSHSNKGRVSKFSPETTEIYGPGEHIVSCYPRDLNNNWPYAEMSGTSMATPFVAGVVANLLLYSRQTQLPPTFPSDPLQSTFRMRNFLLSLIQHKPAGGVGQLNVRALVEVRDYYQHLINKLFYG